MFGVSSMYSGASERSFIAGAIRAKSSSSRKPERSRCESMLATLESRRSTSCSLLISRLNTPTVFFSLDRRVLGDVQREARLADGRPGRDDDQVALLEARRELVQVHEAGGDPAQLAAVRVQVVQPVVGGVEELLELAEAGGDPPVGDLEQLRLRAVDGLLDLRRILVADAARSCRRRR